MTQLREPSHRKKEREAEEKEKDHVLIIMSKNYMRVEAGASTMKVDLKVALQQFGRRPLLQMHPHLLGTRILSSCSRLNMQESLQGDESVY